MQEVNDSLVAASEAVLKDPLGLWRYFETSPKARNRRHLGWLKEFEVRDASHTRLSFGMPLLL